MAVRLATGLTGSGSGGASSTTCSSPSTWTTVRPGRGADSDQPSQPASTSWAFLGAAGCSSAWVSDAPCRNPSSGASSRTATPSTSTYSRRRCSECQSSLTSSQTSRRRPRLICSCSSWAAVPERSAASFAAAPFSRSWRACARSWRAMARPVARRLGGAELTRSPLFSIARRRGRLRTCISSLSPEASGSRSSTVKVFSSPRRSMPCVHSAEAALAVKVWPETSQAVRGCTLIELARSGTTRPAWIHTRSASCATSSTRRSITSPSRRSSGERSPSMPARSWKSGSGLRTGGGTVPGVGRSW